MHDCSDVVEAEGHLVDSNLLTTIFDKVVGGGGFEVLHFELGATNEDYSRLPLKVTARSPEALRSLVEELVALGCHPLRDEDALFRPADRDGCAPEDFYSTANLRTAVRVIGTWVEVEDQRMDAVIVLENGHAYCRKLRQIRAGNFVACGLGGIRVTPEFRPRDRLGFAFMTNEVFSERRVETRGLESCVDDTTAIHAGDQCNPPGGQPRGGGHTGRTPIRCHVRMHPEERALRPGG